MSDISKIFEGVVDDYGSVVDSVARKEQVNSFYGDIFKKSISNYQIIDKIEQVYNSQGQVVSVTPLYKTVSGENDGQWTLSEFLNLQKTSESSAELASYLDTQGLTLKSLGDNRGEMLNNQINVQAALQTIQNFYDMYISPVGETDAKYRLGEVTGKAVSGTVNNQTDKYGRLRTRSLYNTKVDYYEWLGSSLVPATEYYSVLWFPPFKTLNIKSSSWKSPTTTIVDKTTGYNVDSSGYLIDSNNTRLKAKLQSDGYIYYNKGQSNQVKQYIGTASEGFTPGVTYYFTATDTDTTVTQLTMSEYLAQAKEKRQQELDAKNEELLNSGKDVTQEEASDTRLPVSGEEDRYYDTFDMENFLAARSSFTYRAPGFKAINDNINLLQWVLEGVSGITSTFLTEWDISLYLQEGLITNTDGALPNIITLTHRMDLDNPNGYTDSKATAWGVINCAVSKVYGHNKMTWAINAYPYSTWHTLYPDPTQYSGWLDKTTSLDGTSVYIPNFYRYGKQGLDLFLAGSDRNKARGDTIQNRLMFQDFEGAALSGYEDWNFNNKMYKALYTTDDDGFSDIDLIFLQTSAGLYKKRDLISAVQEVIYGVSDDAEEYDGSDMLVAGSSGDGNNSSTGYSFNDPEEGSGGNKYCPGSVFKGALTFLKMFNKRTSSKESALAAANSLNSSSSGNTYGTFQDSLGLTKESTGDLSESDSSANYLLGTSKCLLDNSSGLGIPQYNPTLYGGPHGYYRSPKSYQSYYQENSLYLRNIPRVDKCPDNFDHDSWAGITWPTVPNSHDNYYYKGNEKWCSNVGSVTDGERQAYEQSWSAGLSRLKNGTHHWSWAPTYMRVRVHNTVECWWQLEWHWKKRWNSWWWGWSHKRWQLQRPKSAWNGEANNYYGDWWWEWRNHSLSRTDNWWWSSLWDHGWYSYYWRRYNNLNWYYRSGGRWSWYLKVSYLCPVQKAWHYEWRYTYFKRYVLHSEPELNWKIVQTQSYFSYLANSESGLTGKWRTIYRNLFGYNKPFETLYQSGYNEDYELFIDSGGNYSCSSLFDEAGGGLMTYWMTNDEHRILTNIVDWGGGIGAHNKTMFLTRDAHGNPDCLFRVELMHKFKPVFYWCEHHKTYSSRKKKYWWEKHNGWKHYISVELHTCDRFWAGLSKPAFTNYGSQSNGEGAWGASSPRSNGELTSAQVGNSIVSALGVKPTSYNCSETRKSPYDLMTNLSGRKVPRYNPDYTPSGNTNGAKGADQMIDSYKGISGRGIISDIPGLDFVADDAQEKFSDKLCSKQMRAGGYNLAYNTAFKYIRFPMWKVAGWNTKSEISFNGNTYRPAGRGFAIYKEINPPKWWHSMILNMNLRNTFYRGDTNGPLKETFNIEAYNVDVQGLGTGEAFKKIADRGCTVHSGTGTFTVSANDIKSFTTVQKYVEKTVNGAAVVELHDFVKTVTLKNAWSAATYYFTSYDVAPRFIYNLLATQTGYLEFAKDFICGRTEGAGGKKGDYILSFDFIREIMEGNSSTDGLISPRTYYLANPDKIYVKDDNGSTTLADGTKVSYCSEMYGYNPWIKTAREWFCNSKSENAKKHQEIENDLDNRINTISNVKNRILDYIALNMGQYSYNTMISSWSALNEFIDLKNSETTEEFLVAYLNVLYEARRYFINKRCNKQDGTLWACRHLEKMIPQVISSAVASSANIDTTAFGRTKNKENVAFYELNNTLAKKMGALKDRVMNDSDTQLDVDRIKTVYVKVRYASKEDYLENLAKVKEGTLTKVDERIVPVQPIAFVKKRDGTFKNKESGDTLSEGESWNEYGFAIKKGKTKYAVKPADGQYKLYSKEKHTDEDNIAKRQQNPSGNYTVHNYDEAKWHIDWSRMAEKNQILYNYFGGLNVSALKDLTQSGALDPQAIICGAKESADYWIIPVQSACPRTEGYKTQLTLEMIKEGQYTMDEIGSTENTVALVGAAAYAMWPIIEDQTDVIPNSGDLAQSLSSLGV